MVEVSEETVEQLEQLAENKDIDFDEIREKYKEKYEEVEERAEGVDEDTIEHLALRQLRTENLASSRVPTDHVEMAVIGGDVADTSNGDMFFGSALLDENPNEDGGRKKLASVTIFDDDMAHRMYEAFDQVANVLTGNFAVSEGDLEGHVEVSDSDDTDFEVIRPDDRSEIYEEIREYVPETSIASISEDLTAQTRDEDGDVYPVSSDIRRIEADVYDGYKNPDSGTGIYTLRDNTVFDDEDVAESDVFDPENANDNATPGLTCFFDPNKMEWGTGSVVEFFGTVTKNDDGIVNMGADGAIPILPNEDGFDGYTDSEDDDGAERNDAGGNNVDRTTI